MMNFITAIFRSFGEIFAKNNRKTLLICIALTTVCYVILFTAIGYFFHTFTFFQLEWLQKTIEILGSALISLLSLFLLPSIISAFSELFSESVIKQTEIDYIPNAPTPTPVSTFAGIVYALKFSGKSAFYTTGMMIAYILILPFFLIPVLNFFLAMLSGFILYGVNAYFLGKGYFDTVAMRHMSAEASTALWNENKIILLLAGFVIAFLFTVPLINLTAPIFAFSLMTQLFYRIVPPQKNK